MSGPHPAVARIRAAVREVLAGDRPVLVACSGGADSLSLAAAVAFEAPRADVRAGLAVVDHGLQPGSAAVAAHVGTLGFELGFDPVLVLPVQVGTDGGPEAAARVARYAALDAAAAALGADLLLAHTLDDQAETVLLGLGRGSGSRSVAGMAGRDGHRLRPLLQVRRADTAAACAALGLTPWSDPHNLDPAFRRVRVRTELLPLAEEVLGGGVAQALARTAALARADADALQQWAAAVLGDAGRHGLQIAPLTALPVAVRSRVLRAWAARLGAGSLTAERTAALDALVADWRGQGPIQLPGGVGVRRVRDRLVVVTDASTGR